MLAESTAVVTVGLSSARVYARYVRHYHYATPSGPVGAVFSVIILLLMLAGFVIWLITFIRRLQLRRAAQQADPQAQAQAQARYVQELEQYRLARQRYEQDLAAYQAYQQALANTQPPNGTTPPSGS